jgi:AraC family L-rhamnose operon regulatory protein RhaS
MNDYEAIRLNTADYFPIDFPLQVIYIPLHPEFLPHTHPFQELVLIQGGHGIHHVAGEMYDLRMGDIFVLTGETAHSYTNSTSPLRLYNVIYNPDKLNVPWDELSILPGFMALFSLAPKLQSSGHYSQHCQLPVAAFNHAEYLILELKKELESQEAGYRTNSCALFTLLIIFLSRQYSENCPVSLQPLLWLGEILNYMETYYKQQITIENLTDIANVSERTLYRYFQQTLGISPIEYLLNIRLTRATKLLTEQPTMSIANISEQVGFTDSNYFSRIFHNRMGISPLKYKRNKV